MSLFGSVVPFAADFPAVAGREHRTGVPPLKGQPVELWRETLAAHEPAGRGVLRGGFALLGVLSLASVGYALVAVSDDGLRAAVQALLGH